MKNLNTTPKFHFASIKKYAKPNEIFTTAKLVLKAKPQKENKKIIIT